MSSNLKFAQSVDRVASTHPPTFREKRSNHVTDVYRLESLIRARPSPVPPPPPFILVPRSPFYPGRPSLSLVLPPSVVYPCSPSLSLLPFWRRQKSKTRIPTMFKIL